MPALPQPAHAADGDSADADGEERVRAAANPATWVLDISKPAAEQRLGVDFAEVYAASGLARCGCMAAAETCYGVRRVLPASTWACDTETALALVSEAWR